MKAWIAWSLLTVLAVVPMAQAAEVKPEAKAFVIEVMKLAQDHIHEAKRPDGTFFPAETAEEKKNTIIPYEDGFRTVKVGQLSGLASWCKLPWQTGNFEPFMQHERSTRQWSDKQVAYIALLHGVTMGVMEATMKKRNLECSASQATQLQAKMDDRAFDGPMTTEPAE